MFRSLPSLFSLLLILLLFSSVFSQQVVPYGAKEMSALFPDEQFISLNEKLSYTFSTVLIRKKKSLEIKESYSGDFFTTEKYFTRTNSVFYDASSKISSLQYSVNDLVVPTFPIIYTNYERAGIFHDDIKVCAYQLGMESGKKYRVNYVKTYSDPRLFSKVYFHESYPVHKKTLSFDIPDWVEVELMPINFEGFAITKTETNGLGQAKNIKRIVYEISNIDAIPEEPHALKPAKYLPHVLVFVKSFKLQNNQGEKYFSTHDDLYKWSKTLVDSVSNEEKDLLPILERIKKNETDSFKVMENIFYWVQEHVRYIAFEDGIMGYKPMSAKKVCNMLYGDCKGMANLTKSLLKLYGIDARLTWLGTEDIPYITDIPSLAMYNHMICTAFFRGKKYFLDATEDYIAIDDYAERIQGRQVMIENGDSYLTEKIPYFDCERNELEGVDECSIEGTTLKGKGKLVCNGEQKTFFLRAISSLRIEGKDKAIREYLKSDNPDVTITSFIISDQNDRVKPLVISYDFELINSVYPTSTKEILVLPERDFGFERLEFDSTRKGDYEFSSRYFINSSINFTLPDNFLSVKLPADVAVKTDGYEFFLKCEQQGNKVVITKQIKIKTTVLKKQSFSRWNNDLAQMKYFYHSPLIVKLK